MDTTDYTQLKNRNRSLSMKEFAEKKVNLSSFPRIIFMEITQNCNLHCKMCRREHINYDSSKNMSFHSFKNIADQLFPYAEYIDLRGFGESLILPDFDKFADYALKFGVRLKLVTNFSIRNDALIEYLADKDFIIGVSFDGGTKKTFEKIRKNAHFENVIHNIELFQGYKERNNKKGEIYLQVTVQSGNIDEIPTIIKIAHQFGINRIKLFAVMNQGKECIKLFLLKQRIRKILQQIKLLGKQYKQIIEICSSLQDSFSIRSLTRKRCIHPWMYCTVDYKGLMGYCDNLLGLSSGEGYVVMGDIHKNKFKKIWNSKNAQELREAHNNKTKFTKGFNECNWCNNRRYIDLEYLFLPEYSKYIVSNQTRNKLY